jgi:hypothetical protein
MCDTADPTSRIERARREGALQPRQAGASKPALTGPERERTAGPTPAGVHGQVRRSLRAIAGMVS